MNDGAKKNLPYEKLGLRLKRLRERLRETLSEVSGAVEIDSDALEVYEQGKNRPSEDILELLISHFAVKEEEARALWNLAGYQGDDLDMDSPTATAVVMPVDTRIAYTDMLKVIVNEHGVTLQFMQTSGPNNQPLVVSRLGMSKEHARSVIELIQRTLARSEPKALPPSTESNS